MNYPETEMLQQMPYAGDCKSQGILPVCNGLYGETPPERGTFYRLQVYERPGRDFTSWGMLKGKEICHFIKADFQQTHHIM